MDAKKIGSFIAERRKSKKMTKKLKALYFEFKIEPYN